MYPRTCPAKTWISPHIWFNMIRFLGLLWITKIPNLLKADGEDWSEFAVVQADLSHWLAGHKVTFIHIVPTYIFTTYVWFTSDICAKPHSFITPDKGLFSTDTCWYFPYFSMKTWCGYLRKCLTKALPQVPTTYIFMEQMRKIFFW